MTGQTFPVQITDYGHRAGGAIPCGGTAPGLRLFAAYRGGSDVNQPETGDRHMLCRGSRRRASAAAAATWAAALALTCLAGAGPGLAQAPGSESPNDWPQYHRTSNGWRYSPLDQINKANVGKLKVAWMAQGGDITSGIQETPMVVDGTVYVAALDGKTGKTLWRYQPRLDTLTYRILFGPYSRGVAVGRGKVFIGTIDGRGIALDQKTGKEIWSVQ